MALGCSLSTRAESFPTKSHADPTTAGALQKLSQATLNVLDALSDRLALITWAQPPQKHGRTVMECA